MTTITLAAKREGYPLPTPEEREAVRWSQPLDRVRMERSISMGSSDLPLNLPTAQSPSAPVDELLEADALKELLSPGHAGGNASGTWAEKAQEEDNRAFQAWLDCSWAFSTLAARATLIFTHFAVNRFGSACPGLGSWAIFRRSVAPTTPPTW